MNFCQPVAWISIAIVGGNERLGKGKKRETRMQTVLQTRSPALKDRGKRLSKRCQARLQSGVSFGQPYDSLVQALYDMLKDTYGDSGFTGKDWDARVDLSKRFLDGDKTAIDISMSLSHHPQRPPGIVG